MNDKVFRIMKNRWIGAPIIFISGVLGYILFGHHLGEILMKSTGSIEFGRAEPIVFRWLVPLLFLQLCVIYHIVRHAIVYVIGVFTNEQ